MEAASQNYFQKIYPHMRCYFIFQAHINQRLCTINGSLRKRTIEVTSICLRIKLTSKLRIAKGSRELVALEKADILLFNWSGAAYHRETDNTANKNKLQHLGLWA
jgi:hypothetical protein